jgi:hypothetical protein
MEKGGRRKKILDGSWAEGYLFNYLPFFAARHIQHEYFTSRLPGSLQRVDVTKGPGDSGGSAAFLKFSANQSDPFPDMGAFAAGS